MRYVAVLILTLLTAASIGWSASPRDIAADMAASAAMFLAALAPAERRDANLRFEDENRYDWHYVPRSRRGLAHKSMTDAQSQLAHELMATALSDTGFAKARGIMRLDQILYEREGRAIRDPELYYVTVFGDPGDEEPWGWRVEGHHLSLNLTIKNGQVASTSPTFMGANPAVIRSGADTSSEVLELEQALARRLLTSFSAEQRSIAVYADRPPRDIETRASRRAEPGEPRGLALGRMTERQAEQLMQLIEVYAYRIRSDLAAPDLAKIRDAGPARIHFAWAGGDEPGEPHYYRIHGPTFLIEYDNRQNGANHIHSVWRDLTGDFGADLLAHHYTESPHHGGAGFAFSRSARSSGGLAAAR